MKRFFEKLFAELTREPETDAEKFEMAIIIFLFFIVIAVLPNIK
jgi:hypothetical protein